MKKDDTRRDPSAASEAPATEGAALVAVSALMEERRRYEGWITALKARRATTADHVFERVHLDYSARLEAVIVQLTSHADDLRREMDSLTSRLGALTAEHQRAVDERAEAELRAHVGELSAEDWQRSSSASDVALAELVVRRAEVEDELARTRELLDSTVRPPGPTGAGTTARASAQATVVPDSRASHPVPALEEQATVAAASAESAPPLELPPPVPAAEQQLLDIEERPSRASQTLDVPADSGVTPAVPVAPTAAPRRASGFDELAFLSSVVDTPAGAFDPAPTDEPDEKARRATFARRSQEEAIIRMADGDTPLGSPVIEKEGEALLGSASDGSSSALRRDSLADGVKSLKCSECSAMNYPTEWYCERCGAELASL